VPLSAPEINFFALCAIASNTGCTSDGELAITFWMSAVAVCRSSASRVSLNSRVFSMAIDAWSAKVCISSSWRSVKASTRWRARTKLPTGLPSRMSGMPNAVRDWLARDLLARKAGSAVTSRTCTGRRSATARCPTSGDFESLGAGPAARHASAYS